MDYYNKKGNEIEDKEAEAVFAARGTLIPCKICKKDISSKAEVCPNCGHRYGFHPVAVCNVAIVIVLIIWSYIQLHS